MPKPGEPGQGQGRKRDPRKMRTWLEARGHTGVNLPPTANDRAVMQTMLRVHKVTAEEYERAGGQLLGVNR